MLNKKKQAEKFAQMGKNKYEYDSDEDTEVSHYIISLTQVKYCGEIFPLRVKPDIEILNIIICGY